MSVTLNPWLCAEEVVNYYQGDLQFPLASIFCGGLHFRDGAMAMLVGLTAPAPAVALAGAPETSQAVKEAKKLSRSIALMKRLRKCMTLSIQRMLSVLMQRRQRFRRLD